jgi:hypothetical protein
MVRGSLVSLIYTHSLSIDDQIDDPSAAVTIMSTDVDRICQSLVLLHDLWSRPLELIIGISLLALQIGWVCVMPVAVVLLSAILDTRVTLLIGNKVKVWTDAVQRRISLTADVLSSMKSVKMLGLAKPLHMLLQKERVHELRLQAKFRWSTVWLNTLGKPSIHFLAESRWYPLHVVHMYPHISSRCRYTIKTSQLKKSLSGSYSRLLLHIHLKALLRFWGKYII